MFDSILRHKSPLLLVLGLLVLVQAASYYWISRINEQIETLRHQSIAQTLSQDVYHQIGEKQAASTAIALTLANDVSHLLAEHNDVQYHAFNDLITQITQKSNYKNLWVQVMNPEGGIVYRNWTAEDTNDAPISELKLLQAPRKDIATDSFDLTIRITTPIFHQKQRVGFLCLIHTSIPFNVTLKGSIFRPWRLFHLSSRKPCNTRSANIIKTAFISPT